MTNDDFITSALNLSSDRVDSIETIKDRSGKLIVKVSLKPKYPECQCCGGKTKIKERKKVSYNHLPVAGTPCDIEWRRIRYVCKDCGKTFSEPSPFGPDGYHQTYAVLDSIANSLHSVNATFFDIAQRHRVSSTLVQLYADSYIHAPRMPLPVNLGIDEIHSDMAKYGGSYLCVFVDNQKRQLSEILPDRSKRTLSRYFEAIPQAERNAVKYVTIDMWEPYLEVAHKYLKNAEVAVDPFHVIEHLDNAFNDFRILLKNQSPEDSPRYYLLNNWYKLLLSDKYKLDNEPQYNKFFRKKMNYQELYDLLLAISPDLKLAYELKEMYHQFNSKCSYAEAREQLDLLIEAFEESELECYTKFIGLLKHWKEEIINSFRRPYNEHKQSNALAENINQKLRKLLDVSNGFANFERFRARTLYCLNDSLFYTLTSHLKSMKRKGKKRGKYNKKENDPLENILPDDNKLDD